MALSLSSTDQQVWKKIKGAKNNSMSQAQIQTSLPSLKAKELMGSITSLISMKLLSTAKGKDGSTIYVGLDASAAAKKQTLTDEQKIVLHCITGAGNKGISQKTIRQQIGADSLHQTALRRAIEQLEKSSHIKVFKSVNAPTVALYCASQFTPPVELTGGIWYDETKEYDHNMVEGVRNVLLSHVRRLTFPRPKEITPSSLALVPNPIYAPRQTSKLPSPHTLADAINRSGLLPTAKLSVKNIMEVMRALELDGLVEVVKPLGGVSIPDDDDSEDEDDMPSASKRRKAGRGGSDDDDDDLDEEEKERRREKERQKEKEKAKERKRKERERERKREKEKEREKKRKEKEKKREREKKEKEKEKEKKRRKKEKEKEREKKKKRKNRDASDESDAGADSDALVDVNSLSKSGSSDKKKRKRSGRTSRATSISSGSSSSGSSSGSTSPDSDSDSNSDPDSNSDSDSDVSSVDSDELDTSNIKLKPSASSNFSSTHTPLTPAGLQDLSDTAIVYRAINRLTVPLGQTEVPCGKCPVFGFCEEEGPVNPEGCLYVGEWLEGVRGGWVGENQRGENGEEGVEAGAEAGVGMKGKKKGGAEGVNGVEMEVDGA